MRPIKTIFDELEKETAEAKAFHTKHFKADQNAYDFVKGSAEHTEWAQRHEKLTELKAEHAEAMKAADFAKMANTTFPGETESPLPMGGGEFKTLGERFTESQDFKSAFEAGTIQQRYRTQIKGITPNQAARVAGIKTAYTHTTDATNAGFPPQVTRTGNVVAYANERIWFQDLVTSIPWDQTAVLWMEETLHDDQSAIVDETNTKPQSTYKWEEVSRPMKVIAAWVKVSNQQLRHVPQIRTLIDGNLVYDLKNRIQSKSINGAGGDSDILGILNHGSLQTQSASGESNVFDPIFKAMTKVRGITPGIGFEEPDVVLLNPLDLQTIKLTKDAIGNYLYGSPADASPNRIWGLTAIPSITLTQGTALVGATRVVRHWIGENINITTGWVNTDFIQNQQVILAEVEMTQTIDKGHAWCAVTNIPS